MFGDTYLMKICDWCGRENEDEAVACWECGTQEFKTAALKAGLPQALSALPESTPPEAPDLPPANVSDRWEFRKLTPPEMEMDLVTLVRCGTLPEADLIVSELASNDITAFIPDECLSQTMSLNLNAFAYVRVQVSPKDYALAMALLLAAPTNPEPGAAPNGGPATAPTNPGGAEQPPSVS
jgi:hypothetical protein